MISIHKYDRTNPVPFIELGEMQMALNIHQKISIAMVTVVFMLSLYDVLFHFLLETLHILFEGAEWGLDHLIEHLLETGTHETQVIVFYILMCLIGGGLYRLYRRLPRWYSKLSQTLHRHKRETLAQWQALPVSLQLAWGGFLIITLNGWLFLM